jgi:hypothetical protein
VDPIKGGKVIKGPAVIDEGATRSVRLARISVIGRGESVTRGVGSMDRREGKSTDGSYTVGSGVRSIVGVAAKTVLDANGIPS